MTEPAQLLYTCTKGRSKDAIADIFALYVPPPALVADVTCGPRHGFLHEVRKVPGYEFVLSDIEPHGDVQADFQALPYRDETFDCVLLDPPWGNVSTKQRPGFITNQYLLAPTRQDILIELYKEGIWESDRILKPNGILVVKGQDYVESGERHWLSLCVAVVADVTGFERIDQKIVMQYSKPPKMWNQRTQQHLRANHSWYWILRKAKK